MNGKDVASPEQIQVWMKQTMDWIGGIAAQNKFSGKTPKLCNPTKW
jgi:hypothetical protein